MLLYAILAEPFFLNIMHFYLFYSLIYIFLCTLSGDVQILKGEAFLFPPLWKCKLSKSAFKYELNGIRSLITHNYLLLLIPAAPLLAKRTTSKSHSPFAFHSSSHCFLAWRGQLVREPQGRRLKGLAASPLSGCCHQQVPVYTKCCPQNCKFIPSLFPF